MRKGDFRREAGIDRPTAGALAVHLIIREVGIDDVLRGDAKALQIRAKERSIRVHIQYARNSDS